jgi:hypothetical protein
MKCRIGSPVGVNAQVLQGREDVRNQAFARKIQSDQGSSDGQVYLLDARFSLGFEGPTTGLFEIGPMLGEAFP